MKSGIWHMFCVSKTRSDGEKLVPFLESAGQIYPEMGLTFEAPKCVLPSVIILVCLRIGGYYITLIYIYFFSLCWGGGANVPNVFLNIYTH